MSAAGRSFVGDADVAIGHSETGLALPKRDFEEVPHELDRMSLALAKLFAGQPEQYAAITREISTSPHDALAMGLINLVWILPALDEFDQALDLADDMLARAEATEVPSQVALAHSAYGRALTRTDPTLALEQHRTAVRVARKNNLRLFAAVFSRELAGLEASAGDVRTALDSLDQVIDTFHQTGDTSNLAPTLAYLPMLFDRIDHPIQAATLYGAAARHPSALMNADLDRVTDHLRTTLGAADYHEHVAYGATMTLGQAVSYARAEIRAALDEVTDPE